MDFRIESTRGTTVESVHRVSVAVVDVAGRLVASSGDPDLVTFWRSAAKPFQAIPLVADGAADHWGFDERALALACASQSSEPVHRELAEWMLQQAGLTENHLACGPHPPLGAAVAEAVIRQGITITPVWSNCSGKHAGMLALARHHGWPLADYEVRGHPLQERILAEVARWTGVTPDRMLQAVDGCTTVCFGLPLRAMALAYARFGAASEPAPARLRAAMLRHPDLVGGSGRACTEIMADYHGKLLVKIGADGIYCAALTGAGLGVAVKVEDGDMRTSPVALLGALRALSQGLPSGFALDPMPPPVARHAEFTTQNTRGVVTGITRAVGGLRFSAP
jgi:L-asparaginase II